MNKIMVGARVDASELIRAKAYLGIESNTELILALIHKAAMQPPKKEIITTPKIGARNISKQPPVHVVSHMKMLILDRQKAGHRIDRKIMREILWKDYPLEASLGEDAILDAALSIIQ